MSRSAYSSIIYEEYLILIMGEISYKSKKYILFFFDEMKVKTVFFYHIALCRQVGELTIEEFVLWMLFKFFL